MCQAPLSFAISQSAQIHVYWVSDAFYLIFCHTLVLLPSIFPSIWVFSNDLALCIRWPKYWSFSFSNSPFKYSMNIQGWLPLGLTSLISMLSKGLSRVFSSTSLKASIVWCSAFFMVQLSQPYKTMVSFSVSYVWLVSKTTGKTIVLTLQIFVSKVISLLFKIHCLGLSQVFFQGASIF